VAWQAALKAGARVPLQICENCVAGALLAKNEKRRTSAWLESDRKEALILLAAAFDAANLNVEINLKEISDKNFCSKTRKKIKKWRRTL
jgi:formiminotetrahydrofolate cyclodeaminase